MERGNWEEEVERGQKAEGKKYNWGRRVLRTVALENFQIIN